MKPNVFFKFLRGSKLSQESEALVLELAKSSKSYQKWLIAYAITNKFFDKNEHIFIRLARYDKSFFSIFECYIEHHELCSEAQCYFVEVSSERSNFIGTLKLYVENYELCNEAQKLLVNLSRRNREVAEALELHIRKHGLYDEAEEIFLGDIFSKPNCGFIESFKAYAENYELSDKAQHIFIKLANEDSSLVDTVKSYVSCYNLCDEAICELITLSKANPHFTDILNLHIEHHELCNEVACQVLKFLNEDHNPTLAEALKHYAKDSGFSKDAQCILVDNIEKDQQFAEIFKIQVANHGFCDETLRKFLKLLDKNSDSVMIEILRNYTENYDFSYETECTVIKLASKNQNLAEILKIHIKNHGICDGALSCFINCLDENPNQSFIECFKAYIEDSYELDDDQLCKLIKLTEKNPALLDLVKAHVENYGCCSEAECTLIKLIHNIPDSDLIEAFKSDIEDYELDDDAQCDLVKLAKEDPNFAEILKIHIKNQGLCEEALSCLVNCLDENPNQTLIKCLKACIGDYELEDDVQCNLVKLAKEDPNFAEILDLYTDNYDLCEEASELLDTDWCYKLAFNLKRKLRMYYTEFFIII